MVGFISSLTHLASPRKTVSGRDYLDQAGLRACLWWMAVISIDLGRFSLNVGGAGPWVWVWAFILPLPEESRSIEHVTTHAGKEAGQREHSSMAGRSADEYSHCGNQCGRSSGRWKAIYLMIQLYHSQTHTQSVLHPTTEHLLSHAHCCFAHNSQKLETP